MTVFVLAIYSCVTLNAPLTGELLQKTCSWSQRGSLCASQALCEAEAPHIGSLVFSDVADGRVVERTSCEPQAVRQ